MKLTRADMLLLSARDFHMKTAASLEQAITRAFPEGREVEWMHGDYTRSGTVIRLSLWGDRSRVQVLTPTGKEVWVHVYRILETMEGSTP